MELSKLRLLNRWQWYLGKALCYGWNRQLNSRSLTLAQFVSGHCVLPDFGSFCPLWAFVLFGQGIFLGESSNPFIARGGRLSFYSPCAEGTSICWLSKYDRQFHLIIPKEAQGWAVRRPSLSIEQPNIEHSLNSTWPWSATNMGLLAIRAERHTSTGVILWIFSCRLPAAQLALVSACEGFAQFTQALY